MAVKRNRIRVLVKGGVLSPLEMKTILKGARQMGNNSIHFGSRQDILFHVNEEGLGELEKTLSKTKIDFIYEKQEEVKHQNIVSSYVAAGVLPSTSWVTSGTYLYLLEGFNDLRSLRVNIVDPKQNLVPLFYGHLNFIASNQENYWYLKIKFPGEEHMKTWPVLVFSDEVHGLVNHIETLYKSGVVEVSELFEAISLIKEYNSKEFKEDVELPKGFFPYYEGVNRMLDSNNQWIGFYWRNNRYDIQFLEELCDLCISTQIAKLCITPWKSFLIKEVQPKHKLLWEQLIGRYGINMRHSSFELNWHLPVLNQSSLQLKNYIIKRFDKVDVRTFGLTFSIGTKTSESFTSIVIEEEKVNRYIGWVPFLKTYSISIAQGYNLNSTSYKVYASKLSKERVPETLIELCKKYYEVLGEEDLELPTEQVAKSVSKRAVHQCQVCFTVYDEKIGDELQGVSPGTLFNTLPHNYCCPVCESEPSAFKEVELDLELIG